MRDVSIALFGIDPDSVFASRFFWQSLFFFGAQAPLSTLRDINRMLYSSAIGIVSISGIVVLSILYWWAPGYFGAYEGCFPVSDCIGNIVPVVVNPISQLQAIPLVLYALACQFNVFLVRGGHLLLSCLSDGPCGHCFCF